MSGGTFPEFLMNVGLALLINLGIAGVGVLVAWKLGWFERVGDNRKPRK